MRRLALRAIWLYQRHVSPRKGFCCAYRVLTGGWSCSQFGHRAIKRAGLWKGLLLLRRRFARCAEAFRSDERAVLPVRGPLLQRGHCDLPVDGCHPGEWIEGSCDVMNCLPCDGWGSTSGMRRERAEKRKVRIHPDA